MNRQVKIAALSAVILTFLLGGCASGPLAGNRSGAKVQSLQDPVLIESGYIAGTIIGDPENPMHIYKGIPYAAPPVGDLRWQPPQAVKPWDGIRDCTQFASKTAQGSFAGLPLSGSEDALYLSVVTPAKSADEKLPVMVWMHGGGYTIGSANSARGHSPRLPSNGVVVVNVNMRLGVLGLMAHPLLTAESPNNASGNYMFLDMIASLQWIKKNIAAFGGDPDNVTIFGQSGGGAKVANLMSSPLTVGLVQKVICESGTAYTKFSPGKTLAEMEALGTAIFDKLGVTTLEEARALPWEEVLKAAIDCGAYFNMDATIDNYFLPDFSMNIFAQGKQHEIPFIVIANLGEVTEGAGTYVFPTLIEGYVNMLKGAEKIGVPAYACIFDQVPSAWRSRGVTAIHAMELTYVYGDWDDSTGEWAATHYLAQAAFKGVQLPRDPGLNESDRYVSEAMMKMFTNFARSGNPSVEGLVDWPVWTMENDAFLYVRDPLKVKNGFSGITLTTKSIE